MTTSISQPTTDWYWISIHMIATPRTPMAYIVSSVLLPGRTGSSIVTMVVRESSYSGSRVIAE